MLGISNMFLLRVGTACVCVQRLCPSDAAVCLFIRAESTCKYSVPALFVCCTATGTLEA